MTAKKINEKYVAFLRGINVGGHHKVPMADLRKELEALNLKKVVTILNTGNIIFEAATDDIEQLEKKIAEHLEKVFGFPIPTILRKSETIARLLSDDPFKDIELTKDIRLYVSFLQKEVESDLQLPWISEDESFRIMSKMDKTILTVLDLSIAKTPKVMSVVEKTFGKKNITTRNWKTIKRLETKLEA